MRSRGLPSPFMFRDGYTVAVEPHAEDVLYAGPIGGYSAAAFKDGVCTFQP